MIPLMRKNIRFLGVGKLVLLFAVCLLFSLSLRNGTVLSFEQHLLSAATDHYYLIFFLLPLILLGCFALAEDEPPYVIFRFGSYHRYFFRKWASLCVLPAILVLVQLVAILLSGVGLSGGNTWRLPVGSLDEQLFQEFSQVFTSPLTALAGVTGYLFLGIWLISGLCMWLTHFAGHKWAVRIMVGLYVLSIFWVKVPAVYALPVTALNHLVIFHHNLGSSTRWAITGSSAALLFLFLIGTARFPMKTRQGTGGQRRGIQTYYQKALIQKQNLMILCAVVLGMTVYKGLSNPYLTSGQEWGYHLFSGHGTGSFHILAFLEILLVNAAPLYLIAVFAETSISEQSIFVSVRSNSRREMFHAMLRAVIGFTAIYSVLWFLSGLMGGLFFVDAMDANAIWFLLECAGIKFLDILLQAFVMLLCYLLTKQITVGFLVILVGNFLCVIAQKWVAYLPFGLSGTTRVDWISFGVGIPVGTAVMILTGGLAVTLGLLELLGYEKMIRR